MHNALLLITSSTFAGVAVQLQSKLLDEASRALKPDSDFLTSFAGVVGSNWSSLAASLSLSQEEMAEVKRKEDGEIPNNHALHLLEVWALREDATHDKLYQALTSIPLLQYY